METQHGQRVDDCVQALEESNRAERPMQLTSFGAIDGILYDCNGGLQPFLLYEAVKSTSMPDCTSSSES